MRLPIDTASVKFAAVVPVEADLDNVVGARKNSSDSVWSMSASQVANEPCRSCRKVRTSGIDGTSDDLFGVGQLGRPLGSKEQLLFTVMEVARSLSVSRTKVYELLYSEQLPSVKIGASRRVRRTDLEKFVSNLELAD